MNNKIKNDIEKIYSDRRIAAVRLQERRKQLVYTQIPRIKELDNLIRATCVCISHAKAGIRPGERLLAAFPAAVQYYFDMSEEELNSELNRLKEERQTLLLDANIDLDYMENTYECNLCQDTGYIKEDVVLRRCACYKKLLVSMLKKQSVMFNEEHTFDTFRSDLYSDVVDVEKYGIDSSPRKHMETVLACVKAFTDNFDNPSVGNMIFSGRTGTGKTFMANCVMSQLLESGKEVLFMPANALFKPFAVYENEERETMNDLRDMIYGCDLLIIDDLGSEKMTSSRYSEFIDILNTRAAGGKKILITTNLSPRNIRDTYDERISSRLLGMYDIYRFVGDDIRLKTR